MAKGPFTECPKCGAKVRREKLRRHVNNVHGEGVKVPKRTKAEPSERVSTVRFPWRAVAAMSVVAVVVIAGYWFLSQPPGGSPPPAASGRIALMEVAGFGTIRIRLDTVNAPVTAGNFITLANAGRYDGNSLNRVCAGFVIQGGDVPGAASVDWEDTGLPNRRHSMAMARQGDPSEAFKDTASSTFFINLADNTHLDRYEPPDYYPYVVFGQVAEGQSVVDAIAGVPAGPPPSCPPNSAITITRVTITS